jgi:hypothetical protein
MIAAAGSLKMLVTTYHTMWRDIMEGHTPNKINNVRVSPSADSVA